MNEIERGPLHTYEITWTSGHVERIQAHQVTLPFPDMGLFGTVSTKSSGRIRFHGEIDGRWMLILDAAEEDIRTIRNVTITERELS